MRDPDRSDSDPSTSERPALLGPILLAIAIIAVLFIEFCGLVREPADLAAVQAETFPATGMETVQTYPGVARGRRLAAALQDRVWM